MTTQFGLRPVFATNAVKLVVAQLFFCTGKKCYREPRVSCVFIVRTRLNRLRVFRQITQRQYYRQLAAMFLSSRYG